MYLGRPDDFALIDELGDAILVVSVSATHCHYLPLVVVTRTSRLTLDEALF